MAGTTRTSRSAEVVALSPEAVRAVIKMIDHRGLRPMFQFLEHSEYDEIDATTVCELLPSSCTFRNWRLISMSLDADTSRLPSDAGRALCALGFAPMRARGRSRGPIPPMSHSLRSAV